MAENLLKIGPASRLLCVSVATLRNWDRDGKLRAIRLPSGHRVFRVQELQKILEERRK